MKSSAPNGRLAGRRIGLTLCVGWLSVTCLGIACTPRESFLGYNEDQTALTAGGPSSNPTHSVRGQIYSAADGGEEHDADLASLTAHVDAGHTPQSDSADGGGSTPLSDATADSGADAGVVFPEPREPNVLLTNYFVEVVGVSESDVADRLDADFQQLFHGDPSSQAVYVEVGDDEAYVHDVYHNDTRADALGYGLMVCVLLDHQEEFDRLWRFGNRRLVYSDGPKQDYFHNTCNLDSDSCDQDVATYGAFYTTTALLLAEQRWGNGEDVLNYGERARVQLDAMQHKEEQNGGREDNVINLFNAKTYLPHSSARVESEFIAAMGNVAPAFFEYWGYITQNWFWSQAAAKSRVLLTQAPHPTAGLAPRLAAHEDGHAITGNENFNEDSYGFLLNVALDNAWYGPNSDHTDLADRIIRFFLGYSTQAYYPSDYYYDGTAQSSTPSGALIALNGTIATTADVPARTNFINKVWDTQMPTGPFRFFDGIDQMLSLLYLSGKFHTY